MSDAKARWDFVQSRREKFEGFEILRSSPEMYDVRNYERRPTELPKRAAHINRTITAKAVEQFCNQLLEEVETKANAVGA